LCNRRKLSACYTCESSTETCEHIDTWKNQIICQYHQVSATGCNYLYASDNCMFFLLVLENTARFTVIGGTESSPLYLKIHSSIILPPTCRSPEWSLPFRFSNRNFVHIYHLHVWYMPCPTYLPWFDHPNNIWWPIQWLRSLRRGPWSLVHWIAGLNPA
jgi:hypothetical protein